MQLCLQILWTVDHVRARRLFVDWHNRSQVDNTSGMKNKHVYAGCMKPSCRCSVYLTCWAELLSEKLYGIRAFQSISSDTEHGYKSNRQVCECTGTKRTWTTLEQRVLETPVGTSPDPDRRSQTAGHDGRQDDNLKTEQNDQGTACCEERLRDPQDLEVSVTQEASWQFVTAAHVYCWQEAWKTQ